MYVVSADNFDPVRHLINEAVFHVRLSPSATTQKAQAKAEGAMQGELDGLAEGVLTLLTRQRCDRYVAWGSVPMVEKHHVLNLFKRLNKCWEDLMNEPVPEGTTDYQQRKAMEPKFWEYVDEQLTEIAFPQALEEQEFDRHRQAVLDGTEQPYESDREWLTAKLAEAKDGIKELEKLARIAEPKS
jgi:hypothetical protein